jgi:4-diphosphocytidyl-2-C-methyl-D-erythritol kinase
MINVLRTRAPAKVNLTLHIKGLRSDGYHELKSVVAFTGWGDHLSFFPKPDQGLEFTLSIQGPFRESLLSDGSNLVLRAAYAFRHAFPAVCGGHFLLIKNLPIAAGIGGGSSNAAAVFRLFAQWHSIPLSHPSFLKIARSLGADVPVCINPILQRMEGIGERVVPLKNVGPLYSVLVNPGIPLSTGKIFHAFDRDHVHIFSEGCVEDEDRTGIDSILKGHNDLEAIAQDLCPEVGQILEALRQEPGCLCARMSGSGPTVWGLFEKRHFASRAARSLKERSPKWWVRPCVLR